MIPRAMFTTARKREVWAGKVWRTMPVRVRPENKARGLGSQVGRISGQNPFLCLQCGMCTGTCPLAEEMEANPRTALHLIHLGLTARVLALNTAWVCASCLSCQVVCPRGIDLPRIMEALRLIELRRNNLHLDPAALPAEVVRESPPIALVAAMRKMS